MKSCCSPPSSLSRRGLCLTAVFALVLAACESGEVEPLTPRLPVESPSSTKTRIIGLVGSLSGPDSWRGDDAFEGADLAVSELNRVRKPNEPTYELVTLDDGGDAREATRLVQQLAGSTRTVGIVYAGPPEGLPPAEDDLATRGIPAIICYGDLYSARLLSPHVFQASPALLWEARRVASYLLNDRGYTRVGMISSNDLTGRTARSATSLALQEAGGPLTASVQVTDERASVRSALKTLRDKRVEAVVVALSPTLATTGFEELEEMGAAYRSTNRAKAGLVRRRSWAPQIAGYDLTLGTGVGEVAPPGTIAADAYDRGAHYLPVPSFVDFRTSFEGWWSEAPLGWERRAFDAVRMIGWAATKARGRGDLATQLETLRSRRYSGLDITLGPDDHTAVDQTSVGLWVVPRPGTRVYERAALPDDMPWVLLGRGFSIDGERTDIASKDWEYLFVDAPPPKAPAPRIRRALFGVTTPARDPIH